MVHILYVHWKPEEAEAKVKGLKKAGHELDHGMTDVKDITRALKENPPELVLIDLTRLPSHGREIGTYIRTTKRLRHLPLLFVDGAAEKVEVTRAKLPDAVYADWESVEEAILEAVSRPPVQPVVPATHMQNYSGTPLIKKLGIKLGQTLIIANAPDSFLDTLDLPNDVTLRTQLRGKADLVICFVDRKAELKRKLPKFANCSDQLWLCWPKKAGALEADVSQADIRESALKSGWVDYKIASIDDNWSGLKFANAK